MQHLKPIDMKEFQAVLDDEVTVYQAIETNLEHKKQVIITGDLDTLSQLDTELEQLIHRSRELEETRLGMASTMGLTGQNLSQIIAGRPKGKTTQSLATSRERLIESTNRIRVLTETNRDLLNQSIRFVQQSVNIIASALAPQGASYSNNPKQNGPVQASPYPHGTSTVVHDA